MPCPRFLSMLFYFYCYTRANKHGPYKEIEEKTDYIYVFNQTFQLSMQKMQPERNPK